ncbi:MAG: cytochrome c [Bacteroidota bacterium]|nr:cytochrome c [Bacteroidota bacterium]
MRKLKQAFPQSVFAFVLSAMMLGAVGCGGVNLDNQPKYKPLAASRFFPDGMSSRPLVEGTVPRGSFTTDSLLIAGRVNGQFATMFPFPVTEQVLVRGEDRFNTFCSPCHGRLANGGGMVVQRGFPKPPSFQTDSLRAMPAGFFFDVITNGFGRMYSYAPSVPVRDRWAIVAYIRALQLSQNVPVQDLPEAEQRQLLGKAQ